jgi:hypothetical protein
MKARLFPAVLFLFLATAWGSAQQFIASPVYPEGEVDVGAATTADFNGDGNLDLAFTSGSYSTEQLVIQLGNGDGTFTLGQRIDGHLYGAGIVTGDWNGDGIPDLAVATDAPNQIVLYVGLGNGTFSVGNQYSLAQSPSELAVGDLNGDGIADLVTSNDAPSFSVLLGQGGGKFAPAVDYTQPDLSYFLGVTTGDFNVDGKLDVALTGTNDGTEANYVVVYLGRGDGTFQQPTEIPTRYLDRIITADFNHDGLPDLATGTIDVLLGNGDGTFQPQKYFNALVFGATAARTPLAAADVDGDGNLDLLAAGNATGPSAISVLRGKGDGSFRAPVLFGAGTAFSISLLVADFNNDRRLDAVAPDAFGACFSVLFGDANGKFVTRRDFNIRRSSFQQTDVMALAVADVNSDGNPDVVMVDNGDFGESAPRLILMNGQKNGTFLGPKEVATGDNPGPVSIDTADFNGDRNPDVVTANGKHIGIFLGDGHNNFSTPVYYLGSGGPFQVIATDINGDGKADIVGSNEGGNSVSVFLNDGAGHFGTHVETPLGYAPVWIAVGDFNADGKVDVVAAIDGRKDPTAIVLLGNGDGTFTKSAQLTSGGGSYFVYVGDFNADGKPDILAVSGNLLFYPGNGDGTFGSFTITPGCGQTNMQIGDFNRDGKLDAVRVCGNGDGSYSAEFLIGHGDGTFEVGQSALVDGDYAGGIGDFNHDGALDLAFSSINPYTHVLSILLNTGAK